MPEYTATTYQLTDTTIRPSLNMKQYMQQYVLSSGISKYPPLLAHGCARGTYVTTLRKIARLQRCVHKPFFILNSFAARFDKKVYK